MKQFYVLGVFFCLKTTVGIDCSPDIVEKTLLDLAVTSEQFNGTITWDEERKLVVGTLHDRHGPSLVTGKMEEGEETTLSFYKHYDHRSDEIFYTLKKSKKNIWLGTFVSDRIGKGFVKCLLFTSDPDLDLFSWKEFEEELLVIIKEKANQIGVIDVFQVLEKLLDEAGVGTNDDLPF